MKRFIACLLVLVLLLPAAALADEDLLVSADNQQHDKIKILGRNCYATGEGNDQRIWVFYELYNAGGNPIHMSCDDSNIQFLDANGQEIYRTHDYLPICPSIVEPGERFFVYEQIIREQVPDAFPVTTQAAEYRLDLKLVSEYKTDDLYNRSTISLPVSSTFEKKESNFLQKLFEGKGDHYYEFSFDITNNTGVDITNPGGGGLGNIGLLVILKDKNGAPIYIGSEYGGFAEPGILELKAGETKHAKIKADHPEVFNFFAKYGFTVNDAEIFAYIRKSNLY